MLVKDEFEQLYKDYFHKIYNFFFYSLLNSVESEDLTSITFLKFYSNMENYDSTKAMPATYLFKIARNTLNDYRRRIRNDVSLDEIRLKFATDENFDNKILLIELLSKLSEKERQILYYKYYLNMTAKDISSIMNITVTNVTTICSRALYKARKEYEKNY
ncbi:MAG: RNA polymerase sigma factor [Ruminococcus sp.]